MFVVATGIKYWSPAGGKYTGLHMMTCHRINIITAERGNEWFPPRGQDCSRCFLRLYIGRRSPLCLCAYLHTPLPSTHGESGSPTWISTAVSRGAGQLRLIFSDSGWSFRQPYKDCHLLNSPGKEKLIGIGLSEIDGLEDKLFCQIL